MHSNKRRRSTEDEENLTRKRSQPTRPPLNGRARLTVGPSMSIPSQRHPPPVTKKKYGRTGPLQRHLTPAAYTDIAGSSSNYDSAQGLNRHKTFGSERAIGAGMITNAHDGNVDSQKDSTLTWMNPTTEDEFVMVESGPKMVAVALVDLLVYLFHPYGGRTHLEPSDLPSFQGEGDKRQAFYDNDAAYPEALNTADSADPSQTSIADMPTPSYDEFNSDGLISNEMALSSSASTNHACAYRADNLISDATAHSTKDYSVFALASAGEFSPLSNPMYEASTALHQKDGTFDVAGGNLQSFTAEPYAHNALLPMPQITGHINDAVSSATSSYVSALMLPYSKVSNHISQYSSLAHALSPTSSGSNATPSSSLPSGNHQSEPYRQEACPQIADNRTQCAALNAITPALDSGESAPQVAQHGNNGSITRRCLPPLFSTMGSPASGGASSSSSTSSFAFMSASWSSSPFASLPSSPPSSSSTSTFDSTWLSSCSSSEHSVDTLAAPSYLAGSHYQNVETDDAMCIATLDYINASSALCAAPVGFDKLAMYLEESTGGGSPQQVASNGASMSLSALLLSSSSPSASEHPTVPTGLSLPTVQLRTVAEGEMCPDAPVSMLWLAENGGSMFFADLISQSFELSNPDDPATIRLLQETAARHRVIFERVDGSLVRLTREAAKLWAGAYFGLSPIE